MDAALKVANPAPLGLMGFGMTTVLLNLHNAELFPLNGMILGMGIFYGGIAQMIAGVLEYQRGNTFAGLAFTSYGAFWLVLVTLLLLPATGIPAAAAVDANAMGSFLAVWGLFTLGLFFGTLKGSKVLQFIFASLVVLFALLAVHKFTGNHALGIIAGWEGIVCGLSACYLGIAEVLEAQHGRRILPF